MDNPIIVDLVEQIDWEIARQEERSGKADPMLVKARARITELETALAEMTEDRDLGKQSEAVASEQFDKAEGRVIAEVVAWLRGSGGKDAADLRRLHANKRLSPAMTKEWETLIQTKAGIATALETGEWKK